jgi:methylenetetrahydrofolate reductase (NADPH)
VTPKPIIHPNWNRAPLGITEGYSLEITAKDTASLTAAAHLIAPETPLSVTFLPGEAQEARVAAAVAVRRLGFEPMPHFSARRILSEDDFEAYLARVVREAQVKRAFIVAGDPSEPHGPYADSMSLIATGAFERAGIQAIGVGGHPEGHPFMTAEQCWAALDGKIAELERRGLAALIVTQFSFNPEAVLDWLIALRRRGLDTPVRIGIPGPASIKSLLRFAARCGVGASTAVMKKYGVSITNLLGSAGPDKLIDAFVAGLTPEHGRVRLHFYPFGGLVSTAEWIATYNRRHDLN